MSEGDKVFQVHRFDGDRPWRLAGEDALAARARAFADDENVPVAGWRLDTASLQLLLMVGRAVQCDPGDACGRCREVDGFTTDEFAPARRAANDQAPRSWR